MEPRTMEVRRGNSSVSVNIVEERMAVVMVALPRCRRSGHFFLVVDARIISTVLHRRV